MNNFRISHWRTPGIDLNAPRDTKGRYARKVLVKDERVSRLKTVYSLLIVAGLFCLYQLVWEFHPPQAHAEVQAPIARSIPPVMQRIAQCESRSNHYCTDDAITHKLCKPSQKGQVLQRANTNGTIDTGKYQVNATYWGTELTKQGLDITKEADNEAAAMYIFEHYGTSPWVSSSKCWK